MRKLFVAAATVAIFALLVTPAFAKPDGTGGGQQLGSSSIDLCKVDGIAVNGCAIGPPTLEVTPSPHLGGTVAFVSNAVGLRGREWPMIAVNCWQDVDGNGVVDVGNTFSVDKVYGQLDVTSSTFLLGGNSSDWLDVGGAAECTSALYAYGWKGGSQTIRMLDWEGFSSTG
jgi:hypothetical protein